MEEMKTFCPISKKWTYCLKNKCEWWVAQGRTDDGKLYGACVLRVIAEELNKK